MMKAVLYGAVVGMLAVPAGYAQTSSKGANAGAAHNQTGQQSSGQTNNGQLATAHRIESDLTKAGFTDVDVVAESFVVQAKTKDGDPVLMTFGPHGMSIFQTIEANGSGKKANADASNNNGTVKN